MVRSPYIPSFCFLLTYFFYTSLYLPKLSRRIPNALPLHFFNKFNALAADFSVCIVGHTHAALPLPTDKHFPDFSATVAFYPVERRDIDSASATVHSASVHIFRYYSAFFDFPSEGYF